MKSWIKLHRSIRQWGWYKEPITKSVFIELLLIANWKKAEWQGIKLNVGDAVVGRKIMAHNLGISEQNVRTALKHLELSGEICKRPGRGFTVVHINNFQKYQECFEEEKRGGFGEGKRWVFGEPIEYDML